jgi:hypothetical protein
LTSKSITVCFVLCAFPCSSAALYCYCSTLSKQLLCFHYAVVGTCLATHSRIVLERSTSSTLKAVYGNICIENYPGRRKARSISKIRRYIRSTLVTRMIATVSPFHNLYSVAQLIVRVTIAPATGKARESKETSELDFGDRKRKATEDFEIQYIPRDKRLKLREVQRTNSAVTLIGEGVEVLESQKTASTSTADEASCDISVPTLVIQPASPAKSDSPAVPTITSAASVLNSALTNSPVIVVSLFFLCDHTRFIPIRPMMIVSTNATRSSRRRWAYSGIWLGWCPWGRSSTIRFQKTIYEI